MSDGPAPHLRVEIDATPRVNLALQQNDVQFLRSLTLRNVGDLDLPALQVRISADPPFLTPWELRLDGLQAGASHRVEPVPVALSPTFLARQVERERGHLRVDVQVEGQEPQARTEPIEVLAPTEWLGLGVLPELLAAFVRPNAPVLAPVLKEAAERLRRQTGDASLSGYQSRDPKRVWAMAQALYEAVQARGTSYINPPASFEVSGQKVRTHEQVLEVGQGTCLDLTVLLAALLEQAGLAPLLLIQQGHAFPGVWLTDFSLSEPTLDDPLPIRKRLELGEALVFDSSAVASGLPFAQAVARAEAALRDTERFRLAIDVRCARSQRIRPLPLERSGEALAAGIAEAPPMRLQVESSIVPDERFRYSHEPRGSGPAPSRVERWKHKLLDLSMHNRLLNFRPTRTTLALPWAGLGPLEDALASGDKLELQPKLTVRAHDAGQAGLSDEVMLRHTRDEQGRGVLHSDQPPAAHDKQVLEMWRLSRAAFEESGAVLLYLTLGMLEWSETAGGEVRRAPLILVPVELERGRSGSTWSLVAAQEDTRVNVSLLKKLELDFGIDVRGLDLLPEDEKGFDVDRVLHDFRRLVRDRPRWQVVEEAHLGLFSFQKFLMWLDLEAKQEALLQNPVVRHLLHGKGEAFSLARPLVEEGKVDVARAPEEVLTVVSADPSQLAAVFAAEDGSSFVLQGPPGTGKSQTITNLIAQLLARGRTVLFVSEKLAALEVVQSRLEKIGLGPFCLELHSHQASRQAVMAQLKQSFEVVSKRDPNAWKAHGARLGELRSTLNAHAARLAAPSPFGVATREVLCSLFGLRDVPRLTLPQVDLDRLSAATVEAQRGAARSFVVAADDAGDLASHPFRGVQRSDWSPAWARQVEAMGDSLSRAARRAQASRTAALQALGLRPETPAAELAEAVRLILSTPAPPATLVQLGGFRERARRIQEWVDRGRALAARRADLLSRWQPELLSMDLPAMRERLKTWVDAFFLIAFFMLWGVRRRLAAVSTSPLPPGRALLDQLDEALWVKGESQAIDALGAEARPMMGERWRSIDSDWNTIGEVLRWAEQLHRLLVALVDRTDDLSAAERMVRLATEHADLVAPGGRLHGVLNEHGQAAESLQRLRGEAVALLQLDEAEAWGTDPSEDRIAGVAGGWATQAPRLRAWCGLVEARGRLQEVGLRPVLEALLDGRIGVGALERTAERSLREGWWEALLGRDHALRQFRGSAHAELIERFRALDEQAISMAREEVVARLAERAPDVHAPGDEMGLLKRQMMLQRKHMPIRQMFARIPTTLRRLKPCTLMSPLSVAQYLDPTLPAFDVVVFDEASQIPPWDAVGAIARGRQVIVVGDSRQLPPTSFFARANDDEDGLLDEEDLQESESILDEMVAARLPEMSLKWHYRSQHESLIAFSNVHYYDSRLYTFPSATDDTSRLGVSMVKVEGHYDRGGSRTNQAEAQAVVDELFRLLALPDGERPSVGVLTFSMVQQRLVEDMIDKRRQTTPGFERFFTSAVPEPVFVKNLENVQGDERDVMLFSICYGPDAVGKMTVNFGPLNKKGGERRLNVAITRARQRLVVYTTMDWGSIDLNRTAAVGVAHLKAFLRYAEQGPRSMLATTSTPDRESFDSPFEAQVWRALTDAGWKVHTQVGCSGYRVDLAVVDPERPGTWLIGVECDGASYHGSKSARERDRLREAVLVSLGWRIHRVWSTDWWYDPQGQTARLLQAVQAARRGARVAAPAPAPPPVVRSAIQTVTLEERLASGPVSAWPKEAAVWRAPTLPAAGGGKEQFYEAASRRAIGESLRKMVDAHGPIHRDVVWRAIAAAWGFSSLGKRIVAQLEESHKAMPMAERPVLRGDFFWGQGQDPKTWRGFRYAASGEARELDEVPPEEITNAAAWVLSRALSIAEPELARETAKVFGARNATARVVARVTECLAGLNGRGRLEDGRWRWSG